jgi:asparagine synthase (glutamine-hydrolysing)
MVSDDGSIVLVFNGEIYNFSELRRELERAGATFRSRSDTEVILQGYRIWGLDVLGRLDGMFALAICEPSSRRLIMARDRFGVKPLYYADTANGFVLGSEIKVLLESGLVDCNIDDAALSEYMHFSSPLGARTFYESVKQLEPGQLLLNENGEIQQRRFAAMNSAPPCDPSFDSAVSTVRELLGAAVHKQLVADVPIGVFLSGGIDSSAIAVLASEHSPDPIDTFTAEFAFAKDQSELQRAAVVARNIRSRHHELQIQPDDLVTTVEDLVKAHDQPFGDAADIPILLMCRALNGAPKVILQGDGGDELFAGYHRYQRLRNSRWFRMIAPFTLPLHSLLPKASRSYRALRTIEAIGKASDDAGMGMLMSQLPYGDDPLQMFSRSYRERIAVHDPFARYREMHEKFSGLDPVQAMLYTDSSVILPDIYFQKVDRASMQSSIEVRVPMMDNDLAAYAMSLPGEIKLHGGQLKSVLREALRGKVPDFILNAEKRGFGVPVGRWLKGPLSGYLRDAVSDPSVVDSGIFDQEELGSRIDRHCSGAADYGQSLYKILTFATWYRERIA